jgi:hypothetical protein
LFVGGRGGKGGEWEGIASLNFPSLSLSIHNLVDLKNQRRENLKIIVNF